MKLRIGSRTQWLCLLALVCLSGLVVLFSRITSSSGSVKHDEYRYKSAAINSLGLMIEQDLPSDLDYETLEIIQPWRDRNFSCSYSRCLFTIRRGDDGTVVDARVEAAITKAIKDKRDLYVAVTSAGYVIEQGTRPEQR